MNILIVISLTLLVAVVSGGFYLKYRLNNTPDRRNLEAELDAEIRKISKKYLSYGVIVGVYKDDESFIKAYGVLSKDNPDPPNSATIFQLGSVSKLLTAATLQILCDEGVLRMDASLGEILGDAFILSPAAQQVTLRQLATHTSGLPKVPKSLLGKVIKITGKKNLLKNPYSHLELADVFDYLKTTQGMRKPGRFNYSNFGMGLLGHVMEIVAKKNLESLAAEKLLVPIDMHNTAIGLTPEMEQHLAQGHTAKSEPNPIWTFGALAGAGAFNSNISDMMKFIQANIDGNSPLTHSLKKMHEKQFDGHTGIGWIQPTFLDRFVGNQLLVWHNGMVGGYVSYLSVDTATKTGLIILSNKSVDVTMLGMMLTRKARTQSWAHR